VNNFLHKHLSLVLSTSICFLFFIAYAILGLERYYTFAAGYDLAVIDQAIWHYSHFTAPISTNQAYAFTSILTDHVELIFLLIAPFYWIWDNVQLLILLQGFLICFSGIAVFLLARKKNLNFFVSTILLIGYLAFYGIQNAIWADVHSLVIGISFIPWYVYFLETKKWKTSWIFCALIIISKEDMGLFTLIIAFIYFIITKNKMLLWQMLLSAFYLFFFFFIYFPHFVPGGYRFENKNGLLSDINLANAANTPDKRQVWFYTFSWFGFLPILSPLYLLPSLADLLKYFVLANDTVSSGQSIFGHYRSSLAFFTVWPTIITIQKYKKYKKYFAIYIVLWLLITQYMLHAPLSYLAKRWFWTIPSNAVTMNQALMKIPNDAAVVSQINFLPRLSHRKLTFVMWPEKKNFTKDSPCGESSCNWFRWAGSPTLMIVDTSSDWDARYWLENHQDFIDGLTNLKKVGIITPLYSFNTTSLYKVNKPPN